jgi:hypothetical protein
MSPRSTGLGDGRQDSDQAASPEPDGPREPEPGESARGLTEPPKSDELEARLERLAQLERREASDRVAADPGTASGPVESPAAADAACEPKPAEPAAPTPSPEPTAPDQSLQAETPAPRPPGVIHELSVRDLSRVSIDAGGRLYWDGKPVEVERRLTMSRTQLIAASLFAAVAIIAAAGAVFQAYATAYDWACRRGWSGTYCRPAPPAPPDIPA